MKERKRKEEKKIKNFVQRLRRLWMHPVTYTFSLVFFQESYSSQVWDRSIRRDARDSNNDDGDNERLKINSLFKREAGSRE